MYEDNAQYRVRIEQYFAELLRTAESTNKLYYLLNLLNQWYQHDRSSKRPGGSFDFNVEINRATDSLICDRLRAGGSREVLPHEILFVLQLHIEAKAVYGTIRNFANTCRGEWVGPEPWIEGEKGTYGLQTTSIIKNVVVELKIAGFSDLASEFETAHLGKVMTIRRAVAHGAFRRPGDDTEHKWIFGKYAGTAPRKVYMTVTRMSHEEFVEVCRKFLAFRFGFFDAIGKAQEAARSESSSFDAANQLKPDEMLTCCLRNGEIDFAPKEPRPW